MKIITLDQIDFSLHIKHIQRQIEEQAALIRQFGKIFRQKQENNRLLKLFVTLDDAAHFTCNQVHFFIILFAVPLEIHTQRKVLRPKRKQKNSKYETQLAPPTTH